MEEVPGGSCSSAMTVGSGAWKGAKLGNAGADADGLQMPMRLSERWSACTCLRGRPFAGQ